MSDEPAICELCGEPMPPGEQMFKVHGYSGPCPKPPLPPKRSELIQFHWQNVSNPKQSEFVAQRDIGIASSKDLCDWAKDIIERRKDDCPEGWMPCLVLEGSDLFVTGSPIQSDESDERW